MGREVSELFTRLCLVEKSEEKSFSSRFVFRFLDLDFLTFLRTLYKHYYFKRIIINLQHIAVPYLGISLGNRAEDLISTIPLLADFTDCCLDLINDYQFKCRKLN